MKTCHRIFLALLTINLFLGSVNILLAEALTPNDVETFVPVGIDPNTEKTIGLFQYNGRFWKQLENTNKEIFIEGIAEGVQAYFAAAFVAKPHEYNNYLKIEALYMRGDFKPFEITNIIDNIYKDTSNIKIPISEVLRLVVEKGKGSSPKEIEKSLSELRKTFFNKSQ